MSRRHGLDSSEAASRLLRDGPNLPPAARRPHPLRQLARQLTHFFALMLWAAAGLAVLGDLPQLGAAIVAVILFNALFAFVQEHRAERAAEKLRDLLPRRATVIRDGHRMTIDAAELVVGDLVALEAGDRVSADLRVLEVHDLALDASMLTGESEPENLQVGQAAHAGTFVAEGEALAEVSAVGAGTRLAGIATLTQSATRPPSPLARELRRVVRTISIIAVGVGVGFFGLGLLLHTPLNEGFIFAIGVTVALVPEALLPTVSLSLALGAQRMARRSALVRRLESVETLGSTTFICTDKTGTLTRNQMTVVEVWTAHGSAQVTGAGYEPEGEIAASQDVAALIHQAALTAIRCSTGSTMLVEGRWVAHGDPMEAAIDVLARKAGVDTASAEAADPVIRRFPFDPHRRRMSVATATQVLAKGAPDAVLGRCFEIPGAQEAVTAMAARGLRVLAVACRSLEGTPATADDAETGLTLLGLLGFEDPIRAHAADAIGACRRGGIKVAMITGDHPATALAVAHRAGLSYDGTVVTGAELPDDDEAMAQLLDHDGMVVARVAPEQKLRIARVLQARGHVVAMTGDGVNDGPALQQADIGIAMGASGTDVAREAADLVLLDDDFATIVAAVEEGRSTFANVRRFLTYHLTDNVAELTPFVVWAVSAGRIPLALTVLQILALDLGTDTFSAVALGAEPPRHDVLNRPPMSGRLLNGVVAWRAFAVLGPVEAVCAMAAFLVTLLAGGWVPGHPASLAMLLPASGAVFVSVVLAQSANAFACRSSVRTPWSLGWTSNHILLAGGSVELVIAACFLLIPVVAEVLRHAPPSLMGWALALLSVPAVFAADAVDKAVRRRRLPTPGQGSAAVHP